MRPEPEVVVEASAGQLAHHTAGRVVAVLGTALGRRDAAHLAVTGGGILEAVLHELGSAPARDAIDWGRVHVWWGDERYVAAESDDRNDKAAFATGFGSLPLDPGKIHRMPAADAGFGADVQAAADSYAAELAGAVADEHDGDVPRFDVMLLGIGPDGHCCSLFPGHAGVYELDASVIAVHDSPKPPPIRLSLTFPTLDAADEVWLVASGEGKAQAVALALGGAQRVQIPSAGPRGRHRTLWLIDREAASTLPQSVLRLPST